LAFTTTTEHCTKMHSIMIFLTAMTLIGQANGHEDLNHFHLVGGAEPAKDMSFSYSFSDDPSPKQTQPPTTDLSSAPTFLPTAVPSSAPSQLPASNAVPAAMPTQPLVLPPTSDLPCAFVCETCEVCPESLKDKKNWYTFLRNV
jgi:hypothetical protein